LLAAQDAVVRKIVAELKDFDNLYYEVCNEPYFGGVTTDWHDHIAATIVEAEKNFSAKHLISHNVANGRAKVENPNPAISIFNFHYCYPPDTVEMNYHLNKVIGENETGFRGKDDVLYRTEGWDFIIAGGALYNNLDYSFTAKHPRGDFLDYSSPGGGSPALRKQLKILKDFIESFDFIKMSPDNSVIKSGVPDKATARALAQKGKAYAIYIKGGTQAKLTLEVPTGKYRAEWLNTHTGNIDKSEDDQHSGGELKLFSPIYTEDIALRIRAL
jgi:hypothetical protein